MATILKYDQDEVRRIEKALLAFMTKETRTNWRTKEQTEVDYVWDWEAWSNLSDLREDMQTKDVPNLGRVRVLTTYTGGEDGPDQTLIVFHITEPNGNQVYLRKDGYYYSHDGTYWDGGFYQVQPTEVTITEYQKVK